MDHLSLPLTTTTDFQQVKQPEIYDHNSNAFSELDWLDAPFVAMPQFGGTAQLPSLPGEWPSCSMFMVATGEHWPIGTGSRSDITGEQLNTPQPENANVCGFEYGRGSFGGEELSFGASDEAKVNLTSVFTKNINSITNNNSNSDEGNLKKGQPLAPKCVVNDTNSCSGSPMTPPFSTQEESVITAGFGSWEFESCLEEVLLSPISYMATPHHSTGVASPGSTSGDTDQHQQQEQHLRQQDELETCVDFSNVMYPHSPVIVETINEDDSFCMPLHEEIEQLSNSFYCASNSLISIDGNDISPIKIIASVDGEVSPTILKLLQEENNSTVIPSTDIISRPSSTIASVGAEQPSIANSFFSDAEETDRENVDAEADVGEIPKIEEVVNAVAESRSRSNPQIVFSTADDELELDAKTQTQLEHNYTIKIPVQGASPTAFTKNNNTTVKEANQSLLAKPRETLQPKRPVSQTVKRQLFQKMQSRTTATRHMNPSLKLKIVNPAVTPTVSTGMVINTPDLTNEILDLEDMNNDQPFDLLRYIDSAEDYDVVHSPADEKPFVEPRTEVVEPVTATGTITICAPTLNDLFNPAKRKLPTFTVENLDELTSSTNYSKRSRASATSSTASSVCGDSVSETSSRPNVAKRRGRPPKTVSLIRDRSEYEHLNEADMRYREQRDKNNEASRKSRINRKDRELKLEDEARELKQQYAVLEGEERQLIQDCARWRRAVMRLALL